MSRADYVFDVLILGPLDENGLPAFGFRRASIVAKDESAAKVKAVDEARKAGHTIDLDVVEILATRPFVDAGAIVLYQPAYTPYHPYPYWYGNWPCGPVFTFGYLGTGDTCAENETHVTTGSTED